MTNKEMQKLEEARSTKESGISVMQVVDFGVDRPESDDFWKELAKLGKVERSAMSYEVNF